MERIGAKESIRALGLLCLMIVFGLAQPALVAGDDATDMIVKGGSFGLRANLGFGGGTSATNFWDNVAGGTSYPGPLSSGFAWSAEVLYVPADQLELSLGFFSPLGLNATGSSTFTSGSGVFASTTTDSSTATFSSLPIMLNAYLRHNLMPNVDLLIGGGLGIASGGTLTTSEAETTTSGGALTDTYTNGDSITL